MVEILLFDELYLKGIVKIIQFQEDKFILSMFVPEGPLLTRVDVHQLFGRVIRISDISHSLPVVVNLPDPECHTGKGIDKDLSGTQRGAFDSILFGFHDQR